MKQLQQHKMTLEPQPLQPPYSWRSYTLLGQRWHLAKASKGWEGRPTPSFLEQRIRHLKSQVHAESFPLLSLQTWKRPWAGGTKHQQPANSKPLLFQGTFKTSCCLTCSFSKAIRKRHTAIHTCKMNISQNVSIFLFLISRFSDLVFSSVRQYSCYQPPVFFWQWIDSSQGAGKKTSVFHTVMTFYYDDDMKWNEMFPPSSSAFHWLSQWAVESIS